jgi:hypothetical protein
VDSGSYALFSSLLAGSIRALLLWRASTSVEVVNVAVLSALAQGRGQELDGLLRGAGSGLYLDVARAIGRAALELHATADQQAPRQHLERGARAALIVAGQRLRRHAWLDFVSLAALVYAGIDAAIYGRATPFKAVALLAATLLWLANLRSARAIATRSYAGASALVETALQSFAQLPDFTGPSRPSPP